MRRLALLALCGVLGLVFPAEAALSIGRLYHAPTHWRGYGDTPTLGENLATQYTPGGGGQTYTCPSGCTPAQAQSLINGAANGDTIQLPAGSLSWTSGVTVTGKGITIKGVGTPNNTPATFTASASCSGTVITTNGAASVFTFNPSYGQSLSRLSCMKIANAGTGSYANPVIVTGTCAAGGCPNFRMDNLTVPGSWAGASMSDAAFSFIANVFGVIDHNAVGDTAPPAGFLCFVNVGHGGWKGVGSWGDNSWAQPDTFGTEQMLYLENNTIKFAMGTDVDIPATYGGGARFACRFNVFNPIHLYGGCSAHGSDTTYRERGLRHYEIYYNTVSVDSTANGSELGPGRGGTGYILSNTVTNNGGLLGSVVGPNPQRVWRKRAGSTGEYWVYNYPCNGETSFDTNDGTTYYTGSVSSTSGDYNGWVITVSGSPGWSANQWVSDGSPYSVVGTDWNFHIIASGANTLTTNYDWRGSPVAPSGSLTIKRATVCMDQPARGAGAYLSGEPPATSPAGNPVNQALVPIYVAGNVLPASTPNVVARRLISYSANRDYYTQTVSQAAQTSKTSPFNGTSGSGHGTLDRRPDTCTTGVGYWATDQGTWNQGGAGGVFYKCTNSGGDPWTEFYTPYTYPHPVIVP